MNMGPEMDQSSAQMYLFFYFKTLIYMLKNKVNLIIKKTATTYELIFAKQ